jgi:hypothetical protein
VSGRSVVALKALGYRYSHNRKAWVHRVGGGRYGPVFSESPDFGVRRLDAEVANRVALISRSRPHVTADAPPAPIRVAPADERAALPRRAVARRHERLIAVQWLHDEEHKTVYVDGRPPLVGSSNRIKHEVAAKQEPRVVVPLRATRATG